MKSTLLNLSFLITLVFFGGAAHAQDSLNLVVNGSFEEFEGKLKKGGQIEFATGWTSPTAEPADLYSENITYEPVKVPKNMRGHQSALDGVGYAGIVAFSYQNKEPRTYLSMKLKESMEKDKKYCISYFVSLSDLSKYGVNEITTYISKLPVKSSREGNLKYEAQIPSLTPTIYTDVNAWKGVCDSYIATGQERYITIGNFKENDRTDLEKVKRPKGETRPQNFDAYYYIDKVSVVPMTVTGKCKCEAIDETETDYIFGTRITTNKSLAPDVQLERSNVYYKRYQRNVDSSMDKFVGELVIIMQENPAINIELVGHIDNTEENKKKMRPDLNELDKERAEQLKAVFVEAGVDGSRISVKGIGNSKPASTGDSEAAEAKNRRVEINLAE